MRKSLIIVALVLIAGCAAEDHNLNSVNDLKLALQLGELDSPLEFLSHRNVVMEPNEKPVRRAGAPGEITYRREGSVFSGTIRNNATLAKFSDIRVRIRCFDKSRRLIFDKEETIQQMLAAGEEKPFVLQVSTPPETDSYDLHITGARPVFE